MADELTADDLLAINGGELEIDWFAPLTESAAVARLNEWMAAGYAKAGTGITEQQARDDLARANGYYEAYKQIASALARKPSVMTVTEGNDTTSRTYTSQEIEHFKEMRDSWKEVLDAITPVIVVSDFTPTMSVPNRIRF